MLNNIYLEEVSMTPDNCQMWLKFFKINVTKWRFSVNKTGKDTMPFLS